MFTSLVIIVVNEYIMRCTLDNKVYNLLYILLYIH